MPDLVSNVGESIEKMNAKLFVKPPGSVDRTPQLVLLLPKQKILLVRENGLTFFQSEKIGLPQDSYFALVNSAGTDFPLDGTTAQNIIGAHDSLLEIQQDLSTQIAEQTKKVWGFKPITQNSDPAAAVFYLYLSSVYLRE